MRRTIETAPRDGKFVIVENDVFGTLDVARWSSDAGEWVGENGEPIKITSSHWYPMQRDNYLQEHDGSSSPSQAGPAASRARRHSFFPFSANRAAPQRLQTAPVKAKRARHARWVFAASSITATLIWAAFIGLYFRAEVAAYVTRYAGQQDIFRISTISRQVVEQETQLPSQDSRKTDSLALQQQAEADPASAQAGAQEAAQIKQAVEASAPEAQQSLEKEQRPEVLANELAEARRTIDELNLQLRTEAAKTAQLLGQEREKTAALVQDATAARQELTASTVQDRHALEEERARSAALTSELAKARREIETQIALLRKAGDEALQLKQAAESATAELRQSLQQEREEFIERQRGAMGQKPGASLPAWANSDAFVKPAQTAKQPEVAPENSKPIVEPVSLLRERAMSRNDGYGCQRYRTYDPASGTYRAYDGRRHSCP
jgi:hypothetical protein